MGLFDKMREPVFLKESSNAEEQLEQLKKLVGTLNEDGEAILEQDIKCLEYGIVGEKNIAFELRNSHIPMYILHDVYLDDGELSAQIDYMVFTKKICFVIECKNLYGNIEINSSGDFIRSMNFGRKTLKEGIYSPITQNQRHLELIKKIRLDNRTNIISKMLVERYFDSNFKSLVVLANPKTILNAKYAKKEIKQQVIRADQLITHIKRILSESTEGEMNDNGLLEAAESFKNIHKDVKKDYISKYSSFKLETRPEEDIQSDGSEDNDDLTELLKELKQYRLDKSREEKIKPYYIYNDSQLMDLVSKNPKDKIELQTVSGFGEKKADKYGKEIIGILSRYEYRM